MARDEDRAKQLSLEEQLQLMRYALDLDKYKLEEKKAKLEDRFLTKNFPTVLAASVALAGVLVSGATLIVGYMKGESDKAIALNKEFRDFVVTKQPQLYDPDPNVTAPLLLLMKWTFPAIYVERFKAEAIHGAPPQTRYLFSSTVESGIEIRGKVEAFGGPVDLGITPGEGLTLVDPRDLVSNSPLKAYFLDNQPAGTTGLARRLDPAKYYVAARWNFNQFSRDFLRTHKVKVSNPKNPNSKPEEAQPVDWGPTATTGRVASLSPGLMGKLGLDTDDEAVITIPKSETPP